MPFEANVGSSVMSIVATSGESPDVTRTVNFSCIVSQSPASYLIVIHGYSSSKPEITSLENGVAWP